MITDVVIIILLIISAIYGAKKGLIKIVAKIISIILAFVLAYLLARSVGNYIAQKTSIGSNLKTKIETNITNTISKKEEENKSGLINKAEKILNINKYKSQDFFVAKVTEYIFIAIGFVIVYVTIRIVVAILGYILDKVFELPILRTVNKLGGAIAGIVMFILEIGVILSIIYFTSSFAFTKGIVNLINSSIITKAFYENNIVTDIIISKIIK